MVSSSRIRRLLADGRVQDAAKLLGRHYRLHGEVIGGDGRGRHLGFPTANIEVEGRLVVPADGVYAVMCLIDGTYRPGVASIGFRPTFDGSDRRVEVHLLDFEGDIYGRRLGVDFVAFLRGEERFESAEALVLQMNEDVRMAEQSLTKLSGKYEAS